MAAISSLFPKDAHRLEGNIFAFDMGWDWILHGGPMGKWWQDRQHFPKLNDGICKFSYNKATSQRIYIFSFLFWGNSAEERPACSWEEKETISKPAPWEVPDGISLPKLEGDKRTRWGRSRLKLIKAEGKNAAGMRSPLTRWQLFLPQLQMEIPQVCVCLQRPPPPASSPPRVREIEQRPFNHSKRWGGQVPGTLYSLTEAGISTASICMTNAAAGNPLPCNQSCKISVFFCI